jgi:hypothetical protein
MMVLVDAVKTSKGDWRNVYIRQIDYTQDLLGFFMSLDVVADLKILSAKLDMEPHGSNKQLATCF